MSEQPILSWADSAVIEQSASAADSATQSSVDLMLIERCLNGDDTAYVQLYNLHSGMLYRLAYGLLQHREDAEEVLQDSFEYAFRKLKQYNPQKSAFKTWIYRITVSRCRNKRRRKWLPSFSLNDVHEDTIEDVESPTPADELALSERQEVVWEALKELSPKLRETAVLRYYHGMQFNEIGEILDIPAKTAESRMRLAHKSLRKILTDTPLD